MNNKKHLIVVWPEAVEKTNTVYKYLKGLNACVLLEIRVYPSEDDLSVFINNIYSGCLYDLERIEEKKNNILDNNLDNGVVGIVFSIKEDIEVWNGERNSMVCPRILDLKEAIRIDMETNIENISKYETLHMTDDANEFNNDFFEFIIMVMNSRYEIR